MFEHEQQTVGTEESYFTWFPAKLNDNRKKLAEAFSRYTPGFYLYIEGGQCL